MSFFMSVPDGLKGTLATGDETGEPGKFFHSAGFQDTLRQEIVA